MSVSVEILESIELFSDLDAEEIESISLITDPMKVTEGEILARTDQYANIFYIVLSGNFMISYKDGKALTIHHKGDIMGWSTIVSPFKYRGSVVALTDGEVLTIPGDELFRLIQSNPSLTDKLMQKIKPVAVERASLYEESIKRNLLRALEF